MYESHYGLKSKPFSIVPNPNIIFLNEHYRNALSYLEYGLREKVGFILLTGEIGAGKTTLLKLLLGQLAPSSGKITNGTKLEVAYFDQLREQLDENASVVDNLSQGREFIEINGNRKHVIGYLQDFLFAPARARSPVSMLSGGERNRVHLAKLLKSGGNMLLLDEPTNDLDVETLRALEEAILEYAGCVVVISHDRWFLDRIATHMLAFEGDSHVEWFEGNYADYEEDKKRRLGDDALPHRIKYKKLDA